MTIIEKARLQRKNIVQATISLDDKAVSETPELLARLTYSGNLISVGTRINWNGKVKRAAVDLWDTETNNPDNAPALWEDIEYKDGYRIIPDVITVGKAFKFGEIGWWSEDLYKSLADNNIYTPTQYAPNWEKL